jgi:CheY-like chemotaxis protein
MDGYEATRCIREVEAQTNKPRNKILAFTANVMPEDRQKCIDAGMVRATRATISFAHHPTCQLTFFHHHLHPRHF